MEIDFHHSEPRYIGYYEAMTEAYERALSAIREAYAQGIPYVLLVHGHSTSRPGKTTQRSVIRSLMRSKDATPYIVRSECIQHHTIFVAKIRSPNPTEIDRLSTCYHEAGHAVVAYRLGVDADRISVIPDAEAGTAGRAMISEPFGVGSDRHDCIVSFAGHEAEQRYNHDADIRAASQDYEQARYYIALHGFDEASLIKEARDIVKQNWACISAIATELNRSDQLSWDEWTQIIDCIDEGEDYIEGLAVLRRFRDIVGSNVALTED